MEKTYWQLNGPNILSLIIIILATGLVVGLIASGIQTLTGFSANNDVLTSGSGGG